MSKFLFSRIRLWRSSAMGKTVSELNFIFHPLENARRLRNESMAFPALFFGKIISISIPIAKSDFRNILNDWWTADASTISSFDFSLLATLASRHNSADVLYSSLLATDTTCLSSTIANMNAHISSSNVNFFMLQSCNHDALKNPLLSCNLLKLFSGNSIISLQQCFRLLVSLFFRCNVFSSNWIPKIFRDRNKRWPFELNIYEARRSQPRYLRSQNEGGKSAASRPSGIDVASAVFDEIFSFVSAIYILSYSWVGGRNEPISTGWTKELGLDGILIKSSGLTMSK